MERMTKEMKFTQAELDMLFDCAAWFYHKELDDEEKMGSYGTKLWELIDKLKKARW